MILLRRQPAPDALIAKQAEWTRRFLELPPAADTDWATRSAKKLLREHLTPMSHNKCVYCESILNKTVKSQVEHYYSKWRYRDRVFEWTNLFLACAMCNEAKQDLDHGGMLLKPDEDDGELFFWLDRWTGRLEALSRADSERALQTIGLCNLNRVTLCAERRRLYEKVQRHWEAIRNGTLPPNLHRDFTGLLRPGTEHKFAIRFALPEDLKERDRELFHG
ncbi:MAG: hypothetical protein IT162_09995 [Bryobacterales bacterium]|nr:hypothetical protein [Bryobacterales bacterium]